MKTVNKNKFWSVVILFSLVAGSTFVACDDTDDGSFAEPIRLTEKIVGKWQLEAIVQKDELTDTEFDLTDQLNFSSFVLTLDENAHFEISGQAPQLLPTSGLWMLDSDFVKPTGDAPVLILSSDNSTTSLVVNNMPSSKAEFSFSLIRKYNNVPFVSYTYKLTAVN